MVFHREKKGRPFNNGKDYYPLFITLTGINTRNIEEQQKIDTQMNKNKQINMKNIKSQYFFHHCASYLYI